MTNKSYDETIDWLFHQFPAFQKIGALAYHPTLDNVNALVNHLGVEHTKGKYIHVAGTNGKGSTCAFIASILQEQGFTVGLFTSPHIKDFRERIRINGLCISEDEVVDFVLRIRSEELPVKPSFFELTWVMALEYFLKMDCDYIVVETGLGGRLDATNIITPIVSIITNIGLDHQHILGATKTEIAKEKAGIIKSDVPVVVGEKDKTLLALFKSIADERNASFFALDNNEVNFLQRNRDLAVLVVKVLVNLGKLEFNQFAIDQGLENVSINTGLYGRFQKIGVHPTIIIDAAHNEDGVKSLFALVHEQTISRKLHIIYGAANDKKVKDIVQLFPDTAKCYFTSFQHERAMKVNELQVETDILTQDKQFFKDEQEALNAAKAAANKEDTILIFGSFFLIEKFL
jgi:dihydrofolate synthase/folylpolyglutamate synthase